jgi:hypothetical protein
MADVPVILTVPGSWYDPAQFDTGIFSAGFVPVAGSLLNAASVAEGSIAPGEIVTFHGVNFSRNAPVACGPNSGSPVTTSLAGAQVLIDGKAIPLLYISASQINAIVPFEVEGETSATVQLSAKGNTTTWSVPVTSAATGAFCDVVAGRLLAGREVFQHFTIVSAPLVRYFLEGCRRLGIVRLCYGHSPRLSAAERSGWPCAFGA